jgi:hypothetical protein
VLDARHVIAALGEPAVIPDPRGHR